MSWSASLFMGQAWNLAGDADGEAGSRCELLSDQDGFTASSKMKLACTAFMQAVIDEREIVKRVFERRKKDHGARLDPREQRAFDTAMTSYARALDNAEDALSQALKGLRVRKNSGLA